MFRPIVCGEGASNARPECSDNCESVTRSQSHCERANTTTAQLRTRSEVAVSTWAHVALERQRIQSVPSNAVDSKTHRE